MSPPPLSRRPLTHAALVAARSGLQWAPQPALRVLVVGYLDGLAVRILLAAPAPRSVRSHDTTTRTLAAPTQRPFSLHAWQLPATSTRSPALSQSVSQSPFCCPTDRPRCLSPLAFPYTAWPRPPSPPVGFASGRNRLDSPSTLHLAACASLQATRACLRLPPTPTPRTTARPATDSSCFERASCSISGK